MRIFLIVLLFVLGGDQAMSQAMGRTYRTAIGVKVWDGGGLTIKHTGDFMEVGEVWVYGMLSANDLQLAHGLVKKKPGQK